MTLTAAQQAGVEASLPVPDKEYTVVWTVDEWASSREAAALKVAKKYFQDRIARGENGTACVFTVDGHGISLDYYMASLTPEQLAEHFTHDEHPSHTRLEWRGEVENDNTLLGYWAWVKHELAL